MGGDEEVRKARMTLGSLDALVVPRTGLARMKPRERERILEEIESVVKHYREVAELVKRGLLPFDDSYVSIGSQPAAMLRAFWEMAIDRGQAKVCNGCPACDFDINQSMMLYRDGRYRHVMCDDTDA